MDLSAALLIFAIGLCGAFALTYLLDRLAGAFFRVEESEALKTETLSCPVRMVPPHHETLLAWRGTRGPANPHW